MKHDRLCDQPTYYLFGVMKMLAQISTLGLGIALLSGCAKPRAVSPLTASVGSSRSSELVIPPLTTTFSNAVAKAGQLVSKAGLSWGEPTEVKWQGKPLNRYVVFYATPTSELGYAGYRAVHVSTNGDVWFVPRL